MSDAHGWIYSHKTVPADPWCQYFKFNAQLTIRSLGTSPHLYSHPEDRTTDHLNCAMPDHRQLRHGCSFHSLECALYIQWMFSLRMIGSNS